VEVAVLGVLEATHEGTTVRLTGPRQRALLAVLVAHGPTVVTRRTLVDNFWGDDAPASAGNAVEVYISRLRSALGRDRIRTEANGYRLVFDSNAVDAWRFAELCQQGSEELASGDVATAADTLRAGLALWRGPAFTGLDDVELLRTEADRLDQLRLKALERRIEADLACGRHGLVVPELEALVFDYPLRERFWAQLMRALYADGRQGEALEAFRRARTLLADELGVDPGPELRDVEAAVLRHDARLGGGMDGTLPPLPAELAAPGPTFIGRDAEIAWLLGALEDTEGSESGVAVIDGPPGIGKTRLAAEFARVARSRGVAVVYSSGVDTLTSRSVDGAVTGTRIRVLDDIERLPAITAGDLISRVTQTPPGCLSVICYSEALATLPVRVAVAGLVQGGASMRVLGPLVGSDLARVAQSYDASATGPEVAAFVSGLGAAAPLDAHMAAATWASGRAAQRVRAAAQALPAPWEAANAARELLIASLKEAQATRDAFLRNVAQRAVRRPYLGLLAYTNDDAAVYFGRERFVAELLSRLVSQRFLIVTGASGSGKSSLVRAGLLPALEAGSLPGSETWQQHVLTPGSQPDRSLQELVDQLPDPGAGPISLLVLDQLEEILTLADDSARSTFGDLVTALIGNDDVRVVATLRADFFDQLADWPPLAELIGPALSVLSPLGRAELRQIVEQPALLAGVRLEDGLVEDILEDAGEEPGVLPLLSTALAELWERRDGTKLTHEAYLSSGGVQGAINRLAESTFMTLNAAEQEAARRILVRLADSGPEQTLVRRRIPFDHLAGADDAVGSRVIDVLASNRLLVVDRDTVEVAHEALFNEWDRLRAWLEEDAEGRRVRQQLTPAAHAWREADRPESDLYRGARLVSALEYVATHPQDLTPVEREFIEAGQLNAEVEQSRQRRSIRRLRAVAAEKSPGTWCTTVTTDSVS
jgi:DNA-binding SARP family transcriptional activator